MSEKVLIWYMHVFRDVHVPKKNYRSNAIQRKFKTPNTNSKLKVYQLVLKSKLRKKILEQLSSQELALKITQKEAFIL